MASSTEPPALVEFERTLMVGGFMGCLTYGLHLATYLTAMRYLYKGLRRDNIRRSLWWAFFMTALLAMGTIYIGANITDLVASYIDHRNYPGGPLAYAATRFSTSLIIMGTNASLIVSIFLSDGFLVWRLYVFWQSIWIAIIPGLMWIGGTILGIIRLVVDVKQIGPSSIFNSAVVVRLGTAYFALTLSQTLLVTVLILAKLIYLRARAAKVLMDVNSYISKATIFIESSMLYAVFALVLLVLYNKNIPPLNIFEQVIVQIIGISSDAIILRVAIGSAWTAISGNQLATLISNPNNHGSSTRVADVDSIGHNMEKSSDIHSGEMA